MLSANSYQCVYNKSKLNKTSQKTQHKRTDQYNSHSLKAHERRGEVMKIPGLHK